MKTLKYTTPAAVGSRAEVMAQADYVIIYSGKSGCFIQIKLTEKVVTGALECHWNIRLKIWIQCRGLSSSGVRAKQ